MPLETWAQSFSSACATSLDRWELFVAIYDGIAKALLTEHGEEG